MNHKKKLIEVALPLEAINREGLRRKQKAPKGWPTSFHKWWAQRPLAAARAVIFAQMVDDPSAHPDLFPTEIAQEKERQRLFEIIEDLVQWDNTHDQDVLERAREAIWQSWRYACAEFSDLKGSEKGAFDENRLPAFHDPFSGSGSLPLSAQWLGLESYASDLNPVAVLINKALIEIPSRFADMAPVNPSASASRAIGQEWKGAQGLANDVRYYGQWMREQAEKRIGDLFPKIRVTREMAEGRPDLKPYVDRELLITAWLWTRTVKSPNPAFASIDVPLASTFILSTKAGKEVFVEPVIEGGGYSFSVRVGKPKNPSGVRNGTKLSRGANFKCLMSDSPIASSYIYEEANAGRLGAKLMAIVVEGDRGRLYLSPTADQEIAAQDVKSEWKPEVEMPDNPRWFSPPLYGLKSYGDLFTERQLTGLSTFSDLVNEVRDHIRHDAVVSGLDDTEIGLEDGGGGAKAYAEALSLYLACVVDRMVYYGSSLTTWLPKDNALRDCMPRHALAMSWDFAEGNPLAKSSGDISTCVSAVANYLDIATPNATGHALQANAQGGIETNQRLVISTDPPYYDNIGYADLSDYFYVWLRRSMKNVFPELLSTMAVPKAEELVATPYRHGGKAKAEAFFMNGMTQAMQSLTQKAHPAYPVTIYYAFKQSETDDEEGTTNTGWDTFLAAVIEAGFEITGTWPLRTEGEGRMIASGTNALASSIVLVCRPRMKDAPTATRREFLASLKKELPAALALLQEGNIAPVDLAQAAIGPGMAVYTRYEKVLDADGNAISVRAALTLINQTLDEALAEQEGDFDADSRWALTWFEQISFGEGDYGVAEQLSKSKNTAVNRLVEAGIVVSRGGKVRLLKPAELPANWDPTNDNRLTVWEMVHHLVRALEAQGEAAAAQLVVKLGSQAETARELCYRLYTVCERKRRAQEAMAYNALVQSWPEIIRLARNVNQSASSRTFDLFEQK